MSDPLQIIRQYLRSHFPSAEIREKDSHFEIAVDGNLYSVRVLEETLTGSVDVDQLLQSSDLAGELCRAEGLPLVITSGGIRLSSSN